MKVIHLPITLRQKQNRKTAKALIARSAYLRRALLLASLGLSQSACTGIGIRGELYRVDERQESTTATHKPLKCMFMPCTNEDLK